MWPCNCWRRAPQKTCVGSLLHERVLEQVRGVGRCPTLKNQLGTDELRERGLQILFRESGYGSNQVVGELPANGGADLRHVLHRRKRSSRARSEACSVEGMASACQRPINSYRSPTFPQQATFEHCLGEFLDEQRDAVSAIKDLLQNLRRESLAFGYDVTRVWPSDRPRRLSETVEMCRWLAQGGLNSGRDVMMIRSRRSGA